jgi:hypothetical protein
MLHIDMPTRANIEELGSNRGSARVTLYLPTTPVSRNAHVGHAAIRDLTGEALRQLVDHHKSEVRAIEELLLDLLDDDGFWERQANSLAVFATPENLHTFRLPNRLQPFVEVSDRFHVKPLLRAITIPRSAFVLALAQNNIRLIEVSAEMPAVEVILDGMPRDAAGAAGNARMKDGSPSGRYQGPGGIKPRLTQYARKVDQVLRELLGGRESPLILAATEPLQSIYRAVQSYPHLATIALTTNPEAMSDAQLATAASDIVDDLFREEIAQFRRLFDQSAIQGRATTDVVHAARATTRGAVQKLLIDIDEVLPGSIDEEGNVISASDSCTASYSIIDDIARRALVTGARVLGVHRNDIPRGGHLAAIMRYPCCCSEL